ncbi:putative methyltransferase-domain-containing protein [Hypoxylon sp. FL0890]|nr:putative methyltransferase-domain-containing protein [Hypoxylon sp. FL0890]
MHYIRLLRPAKFDASDRRRPIISLLITITTDLGDSFLYPDEPVELMVAADDAAGQSVVLKTDQPPRWTAGMRGVCTPISVRTIQLGTGSQPENQLSLDLEEDIGESIARHIWDAGIVTACFLADSCNSSENIRNVLPIEKDTFSVLELGSGVGILGITLARIVERAAAVQGRTLSEATVLLTDLPEAEERAMSNMSIAETALSCMHTSASAVTLLYEDLDWDEGKHGRFGPLASVRPWDLIVLSDCTYNVDSLPALVGTLSAVHAANLKHPDVKDDAKTSVILATKPRHSSEQALFELLKTDEWRYSVLKSISLPKLGEEDEQVDIYLLEKGKGIS